MNASSRYCLFLLAMMTGCACASQLQTDEPWMGVEPPNVGGAHAAPDGGAASKGAGSGGRGSGNAPGSTGGQTTMSPTPSGTVPPVAAGGIPNPTGESAGGSVGAGGLHGAGGMTFGSGGAGGVMLGAGGSNPGAGGAMVTGNSGKCTFSFDVTTVTARGRYSPHNTGGIWISDAQNKFVKTLRVWGTVELIQAVGWTKASGNNLVDAVTGATRSNHGTLNATWNCTDVSEKPVPDGQYTVNVTFAESDANPFFPSAPIEASMNFTKSPAAVDTSGQDTANFTAMHVKLTVP